MGIVKSESITEPSGVMYLVPKATLDSLLEYQQKILQLLENPDSNHSAEMIGDYISEEQAKKILGRKNTWFWTLRAKGLIGFTKVGRKVFYPKKEIEALLDGNLRKSFKSKYV
jgi:hypothetical protein